MTHPSKTWTILTLILAATPLAADDSAAGSSGQSTPHILSRLEPASRSALERAHGLAVARIDGSPECRALFEEHGADGSALVRELRFVGAPGSSASCSTTGVRAYTTVGSLVIRLCPDFRRLSAGRAARVLLHEALHSAGLTEYPVDPEGLHFREIDELVSQSCSDEGRRQKKAPIGAERRTRGLGPNIDPLG